MLVLMKMKNNVNDLNEQQILLDCQFVFDTT